MKIKAATTDRSLSELVNAAVTAALREDALDLEAFERRRKEQAARLKVLEDLGVTGSYSVVVKRSAERELRAVGSSVDDEQRIVEVVRIGHRREGYRD